MVYMTILHKCGASCCAILKSIDVGEVKMQYNITYCAYINQNLTPQT